MVAGDRFGAAVSLLSDIYADAEVTRRAGLLNAQQAIMLGSGLGMLLKRVGSGRSKRVQKAPRWPALPNCGATGAAAQAARGRAAIVASRVQRHAPGVAPPSVARLRSAGDRGTPDEWLGIKVIAEPTPVAVPARPGVLKRVRKFLKKVRNTIITIAIGATGGAIGGLGVKALSNVLWPEDPAEPPATAELEESDPPVPQQFSTISSSR